MTFLEGCSFFFQKNGVKIKTMRKKEKRMIKILLCCGGGFSSSAMAVKVQKEIIEKGLQDEVSIEFSPASIGVKNYAEYDIIFLCPHRKFKVKEYNEEYVHNQVPMYLIPPRIYGQMAIEDVLQDAKDLLEIFKENPQNPVHFPGEDNVMVIKRSKAYAFSKK